MTIFTKFWRTKAMTIVISIVAMMLVWGALAWPDWTSTKAAPYDPNRAAWEWMASLTPEQRQTLIAVTNQSAAAAPPTQPVAAEPPPMIVQHVTVVRHVPAGTAPGNSPSVVTQPGPASGASAPPPQAGAPAAPSAPAPRSSAPAPVSAPLPVTAPTAAPAPAPPSAPAPPPPPVTTTRPS